MSTKLKPPKDTKTEFLISGYIRNIKIIKQIIPYEVINLCLLFYYSFSKMFLIKGDTNDTHNEPRISIVEIDTKNNYQCQLNKLNISTNFEMQNTIDGDLGLVYVKDFSISSKIISSISNNKLLSNNVYDVIFAIGSEENPRAYVFDKIYNYNKNEKINTYYWRLPTTNAISSLRGPYVLYSKKYGIITIGNNITSNSFNILNINKEENSEWKLDKMETRRKFSSCAWLNDDEIICVGGNRNYKYVDIYDFNTNKWIKVADTILNREASGIFVDKYINKRVYIIGGMEKEKFAEYYDINKNIWNKLPNLNNAHYRWPVVWSESNINNMKWKTYMDNNERNFFI